MPVPPDAVPAAVPVEPPGVPVVVGPQAASTSISATDRHALRIAVAGVSP